MNDDQNIRAALDRHWAASDANDFDAEHEIYRDDAIESVKRKSVAVSRTLIRHPEMAAKRPSKGAVEVPGSSPSRRAVGAHLRMTE